MHTARKIRVIFLRCQLQMSVRARLLKSIELDLFIPTILVSVLSGHGVVGSFIGIQNWASGGVSNTLGMTPTIV